VILFGIAAGVTIGFLCGRFVESQLFGIEATNLLIFATGGGVLLTVSLAAAFLPAWRASRIDPMKSLRHE
jgi:ABC-type antimicrobial peptide transport system permease subunit